MEQLSGRDAGLEAERSPFDGVSLHGDESLVEGELVGSRNA